MNYSTITHNTADIGGGISDIGDAIESYKSIITLNYSTISDNLATGDGGGGIWNRSSLIVNHSTITGNIAYKVGGGGILNSGSLTVNYSTISSNQVKAGQGGGIFNDGTFNAGNVTLNYSTISDNTAKGEGGGIFNTNNLFGLVDSRVSDVTVINNSTISGNTAQEGGGIYNYGILQFSSVDAQVLGTIFALSYGSLIVTSSTISDNHATTGGGIYNNGTLSVSHSNISNNYARDYGGGIYNSSSNGNGSNNQLGFVTLIYSSISGNTAGQAGGGIYNNADDGGDYSGSVNIDTQFVADKGDSIKGVVPSTQLGIVTVSNSTISDNQAHFGGGIYNDGILTVGNSTITHNKAFGIELSSGREESGKGGGIYNSSSSYATATVDYSTIACNFDTPQEDSTKVIKSDDLVGKFITKYHHNRICNLSGSTFSYN
ncbi:MAG: hypothetical protein V7K86_11120 [Nostoc sp.]|uniref:hypothetical protein n=1 Tax=Nostoc sp. TaxID=1180 RepID=UPI002FF4F7EB